MSTKELKLEQIEDLIALRHLDAVIAPTPELEQVRANLERRIGTTVSQRTAACVLNVSPAALGSWTRSGDLPLVMNENGRNEFPTGYLIDLAIAIDRERGAGGRAHSLEPVMREQRRRAERILKHPEQLIPSTATDPHNRANHFALAYHQEVARHLTRAQADDALRRVWRLRYQGRMHRRYADCWERILNDSLAEVKAALTDETEAGIDLRQNSPFAGTLSEPERRAIFELVAA
ncbi:MAG: hypothetical protein HY827_04420 [Actinobacteria bacterium]|nr:hypothetical protein [Actinomycetota bacterium]